MNDFDKQFDQNFAAIQKTAKRGFFTIAILWVFGAIASLGVTATILYIIWRVLSHANLV